MTRVLTEELREEFKEPFGRLVEGSDRAAVADEAWTDDAPVVAVGDIVTHSLLETGHVPKTSVIDDRSMREETGDDLRAAVRGRFDRVLEARNPPGHLTDDLDAAVRDAVRGAGTAQVVVDGEEDLAVIPVVLHADVGSRVLYGQPDCGVVVVEVTEERKREIKRLVDTMEVIDGDRDH